LLTSPIRPAMENLIIGIGIVVVLFCRRAFLCGPDNGRWSCNAPITGHSKIADGQGLFFAGIRRTLSANDWAIFLFKKIGAQSWGSWAPRRVRIVALAAYTLPLNVSCHSENCSDRAFWLCLHVAMGCHLGKFVSDAPRTDAWGIRHDCSACMA
jgi:hypothetical protein